MRKVHFATPSETASDVFARFSSPAIDFGVPMLAGRARAGDVVEVAGVAQWLLSEMMSHMLANVVATCKDSQMVVLIDVQLAHDLTRTIFLVREALRQRGATEEDIQVKLEQLKVLRCDSTLHLLCALRQCEEMAEQEMENGSERRLIVFVDGMSNLFWPNKQIGKGNRMEKRFLALTEGKKVFRGLDLVSGCVKLLRQLALKQSVSIVASKLVFFPRKGMFEDYFGNGWKSTCKILVGVEDVKMTAAALGKTGQRAMGFLSESEQPEKKIPFQVHGGGCQFA